MPLVFAGIVPHTPLLMPSLAKDSYGMLGKTARAVRSTSDALYIRHPDVVCIISNHASQYADSFVINSSSVVSSDFSRFGDIVTSEKWRGAPEFAARAASTARAADIPMRQVAENVLDYGTGVAASLLLPVPSDMRLIQIGTAELPFQTHYELGRHIMEFITHMPERIAVIASGDLSHALIEKSPAGFEPDGVRFDELLRASLNNSQHDQVLKMQPELIERAHQCIYRPLLIILGLLAERDAAFRSLCYEAPVGVGYLTGIFELES